MPNYGYHFARLKGDLMRRLYRAFLPITVRRPAKPPRSVPLEVFSYSGENGLPEQVASIRSFLRHVGRPKRLTVVSDGSYSQRGVELLEHLDPVVSVQLSVPPPPSHLPEKFRRYLSTHPTGKQLALIMSLPGNGPALYLDSDVLFFPSAVDLISRAGATGVSAYYLADCQFAGDTRLLRSASEEEQPENTGFLLLIGRAHV